MIANLLSLLNVSTFLQDAFRGALILVAVTLATVQFTRRKKTSPTAAGRQVVRYRALREKQMRTSNRRRRLIGCGRGR